MLAAASLLVSVSLHAQEPGVTTQTAEASPTLDSLVAEVRRLQQAIETLQTALADARRQTAEAQQSLADLREQLAEERELLAAQMATLEQSKVESGSKYRVRLFGMGLMQLISTRGAVDNIDLPILAVESVPGDSGGNISAAVRQSYLGVAVFGPPLGDFDTSASLSVDFFGGFPDIADGLSAPGVRLRTISFAAEGARTSLRAGQDTPFFSPASPASLASTAYPALSSSGNIWSWMPQVYVERRYQRPDDVTVTLQGGVLDSFTGEVPAGEYSRLATAGERSRQPAYAGRLSWRRRSGERTLSAGGAGYYSRHDWGFRRPVNAWAMMADWEVPLWTSLTLSGELYRGQAIGGLGGGAHSSVLFNGAPTEAASTVHPLRSRGGWTQVKFQQSPRIEFNAAFGIDLSRPRPFNGLLQPPQDEAPSASRNASGLLNVIYQLRSNIFYTVEYRRLWTRRLDGRAWLADHLSFGGGIVF
ncbi:MAG: hypothetical protein HOP16_07735 [Acidobacteria bacterium]|nr:hypothetical protein [Acidobacteriota bacterium]